MDKWNVKTATETVTVTAHKVEVLPCGALRLSNNSGQTVEIWAGGQWTHVQAKAPTGSKPSASA